MPIIFILKHLVLLLLSLNQDLKVGQPLKLVNPAYPGLDSEVLTIGGLSVVGALVSHFCTAKAAKLNL